MHKAKNLVEFVNDIADRAKQRHPQQRISSKSSKNNVVSLQISFKSLSIGDCQNMSEIDRFWTGSKCSVQKLA